MAKLGYIILLPLRQEKCSGEATMALDIDQRRGDKVIYKLKRNLLHTHSYHDGQTPIKVPHASDIVELKFHGPDGVRHAVNMGAHNLYDMKKTKPKLPKGLQ